MEDDDINDLSFVDDYNNIIMIVLKQDLGSKKQLGQR